MFSSYARMLINFGASHSLISYEFATVPRLKIEPLSPPLVVTTPISGVATLSDVCRSCTLDIAGCMVVFDMVLLNKTEFDIIVGMDWLSAFWTRIDCHQRSIFQNSKRAKIFFVGNGCIS